MLKRILTFCLASVFVFLHSTKALASNNRFDVYYFKNGYAHEPTDVRSIGTWSLSSVNSPVELYEIDSTLSSPSVQYSLGSDDDRIKDVSIDGHIVEKYSYPYQKSSVSVGISQYLDGKIHSLTVTWHSSGFGDFTDGIAFVSNAENLIGYEDKILYTIANTMVEGEEGESAIVNGYLFGLNEANISNSIWVDNKEYPVRSINDYAFNPRYSNETPPSSIVMPQNCRRLGGYNCFGSGIQDLTILSSANLSHYLGEYNYIFILHIPKNITLHTFPKNIKAFYSRLGKAIKIEPLRDIEILDEGATLDHISFRIKNDIGANIYSFQEEENGTMTVSNGIYVDSNILVDQENKRYLLYEHPDYGKLDWTISIMAPSPISSVECETTQSTATFHVNTYQNDSRIGKPYALYNDKFFYGDNNGDLTISGLDSNSSDSQTIRVVFNGQEYTMDCSYKTLPMNPDVIAEVGPTSITLTPTYDKIDGIIRSSSLTVNGQEYAGKNQIVTGLPIGSDVSVVYSLNNENVEKTFQLPELVLTTLPARATSKDCAIICAETNMSEDEIGGGFEWRRYDAPDMVPSNSVACPVANGHMEGRLNGLSSGSYYKYRPFYEDASGHKTYGEWTAFGTADVDVYFVPTVYTYTARSVGSTSATLVGYALAGSEDITEQGFEYWPEVKSRAATTEVKRVLATGQRMMATIDDLEPGMTYNVRAFAMTATETTYGELQQFETEAVDDPIKDSIETVEIAEPAGEFDIYNLQGRCVRRKATDFSGLRSGIYIANGRKIMVR